MTGAAGFFVPAVTPSHPPPLGAGEGITSASVVMTPAFPSMEFFLHE